MRRFEFQEGSSSKFWEVDVQGRTLQVRFGKIGTAGQTQEKSFASAEAAAAEANKLVKQKVGKGYTEVAGGGKGSSGSPAKADAAAPKYVEQVLHASEVAGKKMDKALAAGGDEASVRLAVVKALGDAVDANTLPAWLMVPHAPLERIVHLAPPLFDAVGVDGDEFWGDPPEEPQWVWDGKRVTRRSPDGEDQDIGKLTEAQLAEINCYDGGLVFASIRWTGARPGSIKDLKRLLVSAEAAYGGELAGYDARDHAARETTTAARAHSSGKQNGAVRDAGAEPSHATFLGGPLRQNAFDTDFAKAPSILFARVEPDASGGEFGGSVIVGEGIAFGAAGVGFVHNFAALEARTGRTRWTHVPSKQQCFPRGEATIANGTVFIGTSRGCHAVDVKTGKALWTAALSTPCGAPLVLGDLCIVGAKKGVYALSISEKGRKAWTFPLTTSAAGSIAYGNGVLYVMGDKTLFALSAADGKKVMWKLKAHVNEFFRIGPLVTDEHVFTPLSHDEFACVDRATGKVAWKQQLAETIEAHGWAFKDGTLVVKDGNGSLHAFDEKSGELAWKIEQEESGSGKSAPTISGSSVIAITAAYDQTPRLRAWDLATGKERWEVGQKVVQKAIAAEQKKTDSSFEGEWNSCSTPFVADGILYVQTDAGLVALK